ncbi:MAG: GNAT family N-acetyltransferase [Polyangiaceae bacterium]|nr:GNAT family N-acetyltransferase [Myxococcales bacterium]MCB9584423.1 GNAT family N-acetyltransferase [Polyangiaceae bacterium]
MTHWAARPGYLVSRTPERIDFNYGHALLLDGSPSERGVDYWVGRWLLEQQSTECDRAFLLWEEPGEATVDPAWVAELDEASQLYVNHCLGLDGRFLLPRALPPTGIEIRAFDADADWRQAVELTANINDDGGFFATERAYWLYEGYRELIRGGEGEWLGAFTDAKLVGALGLIRGENEARFQDVLTHPEYRKRGICSALLRTAIERYRTACGAHPVFILAKSGADSERLYTRFGFTPRTTFFELAIPVHR